MRNPSIYDPDDPIEVAVKTNLKKKQTVSSFAELCRLCNVSLGHGGKQRRNAEAKISQYIDYAVVGEEGQRRKSYVINEIFEIPHVHSRRNSGKYRDRLMRALYYDLMNADNLDTDGLLVTDYDDLAVRLGFVNRHYRLLSDYRYKSRKLPPAFDKEVSPIHPLLISEFLMTCKSRYKAIIMSMLDDFLSKGMMESKQEKIELVFLDNSRRWAEDWEVEIISRLHSEYFPSGQAQFMMKESERRRRYSAFIRDIDNEREDHYNKLDEVDFKYVKYYQTKLLIVFDKAKMRTAAIRNEISLIDEGLRKSEKEEVSALFHESMRQLFARRYSQKLEVEKGLVEYRNKGLAFGEVADNTPLQPILADYTNAMDILLFLTVSISGAIALNSTMGTY